MWGGYNPRTFEEALVSLHTIIDVPIFAWWEYSLYVSLIGIMFLVYFGIWGPFLKLDWQRFQGWSTMALPCIIIFGLSFWELREYMIPTWVPFLNIERLPTRYMVIPLLFVTVIASINFEGFIRKYWSQKRVIYFLVISVFTLAVFLFNHSRVWRMHKVQNEFYWYNSFNENERIIYQGIFNIQLYINNNLNDTIYIAAFWSGLTLSILSLFLAAWLLWRDRGKINKMAL